MKKGTTVLDISIRVITTIYIMLILCIYPLLVRNKYTDILQVKTSFLFCISLGYAVFCCLFFVSRLLGMHQKHQGWKEIDWNSTDTGAVLLAVCSVLSWVVNGNKRDTLLGTYGRNMGLLGCLICVMLYFVCAKILEFRQEIMLGMLVAATIVCVIAALNNLGFDPLQMYEQFDRDTVFVSTIGNVNCLSAYIGMLLSLGMGLFVICENRLSEAIYGMFCMAGFFGAFSAKSDSIFLMIAVAVLILLVGRRTVVEYRKIAILGMMYAVTGLLMKLFRTIRGAENCIKITGLPVLLLNVYLNITILILATGCFFLLAKKGFYIHFRKTIIIALGVMVVVVLATFILANNSVTVDMSKKILGDWYSYLHLSEKWGTNRVKIWHAALTTYGRMPIANKLLGYGPAGFYYAIHAFLNKAELEVFTWGNLIDAHSEYLQYLISTGLVGLTGYVLFLLSGCIRFFKNIGRNKYSTAFAVFIVAFMIQACINNVHIYIEPLMFILLGIGMNQTKNER